MQRRDRWTNDTMSSSNAESLTQRASSVPGTGTVPTSEMLQLCVSLCAEKRERGIRASFNFEIITFSTPHNLENTKIF